MVFVFELNGISTINNGDSSPFMTSGQPAMVDSQRMYTVFLAMNDEHGHDEHGHDEHGRILGYASSSSYCSRHLQLFYHS